MRTCYCRKCGTPNQLEDGQVEYTCSSCGSVNQAPAMAKPAAPAPAPAPAAPTPAPAPTPVSVYAPVAEEKKDIPTYEYDTPVATTMETTQDTYTYTHPLDVEKAMNTEAPATKKKKTGLIITLSVIVAVIAAALVLLLTPVKSPLPIKLRCDECESLKMSHKYEVSYPLTGEEKTEFICDDCFERGYEEQ
jgi:hypothetical protein